QGLAWRHSPRAGASGAARQQRARAPLLPGASRRPDGRAAVRHLPVRGRAAAVSSPARQWALIAGVFVGVVAIAASWLALDRRPPEWDYANHLENALLCRRDLTAGELGAVFARGSCSPPLVSCVAGLVV